MKWQHGTDMLPFVVYESNFGRIETHPKPMNEYCSQAGLLIQELIQDESSPPHEAYLHGQEKASAMMLHMQGCTNSTYV